MPATPPPKAFPCPASGVERAVMSDLPPGLHPGMRATFVLADGTAFAGEIQWNRKGWAKIGGDQGTTLIQLAHVAVIRPLGPLDEGGEVDEELPKPRSKEGTELMGPTAPGRAWRDDDLRAIADAFLDGVSEAELATRYHRTKSALKELRQGFECARGNLVEDQISPVARTWVARLRKVLAG
jgi:hypothetical protein